VIPTSTRIFVCTEPVDMRRSFDGLTLVARQQLGQASLDGGLFVFANRRRTRLKVLWLDGSGLCILYKRLHRALFELPEPYHPARPVARIDTAALSRMLRGVPRPAGGQRKSTRR